jgi:hypothetical protein
MGDFQGGGLRVVDVSNPANPIGLGFVGQPGPAGFPDPTHGVGWANRVQVTGTTAYVSLNVVPGRWTGYETAPRSGGLALVDVSDPANPRELAVDQSLVRSVGVTAAGGRAYVAAANGLAVYDVSSPTSPTVVARRPTPSQADRSVVSGSRAYVSSVGGGLHVLDLTDPVAPVELGYLEGNVVDLAVSGTRVYIGESAGYPDFGGVRIVDTSSPTAPTVLSRIAGTGDRGVAVVGSVLYALSPSALSVYDVSDGSSPRPLGSLALGGTNLRVAGDRAYVTAFGGSSSSLHVVDVSDPAHPTLLWTTGAHDPWNIAIAGARVYLAEGTAGLRVLGTCPAADPSHLTTLGQLDTPGVARGVAVLNGIGYLADTDALRLVDVADPTHPTELAAYAAAPARAVTVAGGLVYLSQGPMGVQVLRTTATASTPPPATLCRTLLPAVGNRIGI